MDLRHSQEQVLIYHVDDGTDRLHQTYNLQSSCRIGIQADQVSQEICSPSAEHKTPEKQSLNEIENMSLEILHLMVPPGGKLQTFDHFLLFVVDCPN